MTERSTFALLLGSLALAPVARAQTITGPAAADPLPLAARAPRAVELAGDPLAAYPFFQTVRVVHEGAAVHLAVDPLLVPEVAGVSADVYVVAAKGAAGWQSDPTLADVRGGPQAAVFPAAGIQASTLQLDPGTLSGDAGTGLGVGYDVVIDVDRDALLGAGDVIDGLGDEAGFYVVRDTTQPGPLQPVVELTYSGGSFLGQNTFYPPGIASMGELPLIVVSHGNGHNYQWYDHIGRHLASYGYVVMSHENNTGPGSSAASLTTLSNTDYLLANQATIGGGVLNGHLDADNIVFVGHSRGGEGVVRAYTRLLLDEYQSPWFDEDDVKLVVSIAPVTHIDSSLSFPGEVNFCLMYGAADADVSGSPTASASKPFAFYERAQGEKSVLYVQGVGHAWFHNGGGSCVCTGPALLNQAAAHDYELGYLLPLVKRYVDGSFAARDFLERMDSDLRPLGLTPAAIAAKEYRPAPGKGFVIDDYQSNFALALSSSGGAVGGNVLAAAEDLMRDQDGAFTWSTATPMNGMTRYDDGGDDGRCVVFEWAAPDVRFYELEIVPAERDLSDDAWLSFRACQGTRHPQTDLLDGPLSFTVVLRDEHGTQSSIRTDLYGDVTRTYERTGSGIGAGWANEMSTVRLRLADFLVDGSGLDLGAIEAVRFAFGGAFGSARGRLALDDVEILAP